MTKEFIEELIQRTELQLKAMAYDGNNDQQLYANKRSLIDWLRRNPAMSGEDLLCPRCNEELYNRKHPVMQEGKEEMKIFFDNTKSTEERNFIQNAIDSVSHLPVDDEQPEHKGMPLLPTPYSNTNLQLRSNPSQDLDTLETPEISNIVSNFIEQARDAEMKLIAELFKTATGEELTEQNAHRVGLDFGYDRCLSIDGKMIGEFKQEILPTDNGHKYSITFVPYG